MHQSLVFPVSVPVKIVLKCISCVLFVEWLTVDI